MKLNSIKKLSVVLCLAACPILYTSCNKMLDLKPKDQVDGEDIFQSLSTVNRAVLGVYASWVPEYTLRIGSVVADECAIGLKNAGVNGDAQHLYRWSFTSFDPEILNPWTNGYQVINQVNRILEGLPKVPANSADEAAEKLKLESELLAIRAYEHFELYRLYASSYKSDALAVPYVTNNDVDAKPSRPTAAEFFSKLELDLNAALENSNDDIDITRMNRIAMNALQARIALYTGNWNDAVKYADKVIAARPLATINEFADIWKDKNNAEVVFKLKRTNQSTIRPGDIWKNAALGIVYFAPSQQLLDSYDQDNDIRYDAYFDHDPSLEEEGQLPDVIAKYAGEEGAENRNDIKIFRTSEMYLIRAEAYANLGSEQLAADQLNALRASRIEDYEPVEFEGAADLKAAIMEERLKELPFEGHRFFDLKRWGKSVVRKTITGQDVLSPADLYYYIPIPQAEVLSNPNIRPNNSSW
ncbi:RagB/SusD family nutrient uptake outer membrane protein [Chitinophaga silvatica]|nr:RagB/SusD family nutrient uptake outer membrane protein [Chitinophaga silvatica]